MRTEVSESADDNMVTFLEAEVDAMVGREVRAMTDIGESVATAEGGYNPATRFNGLESTRHGESSSRISRQ
jgi:hypothetical protein